MVLSGLCPSSLEPTGPEPRTLQGEMKHIYYKPGGSQFGGRAPPGGHNQTNSLSSPCKGRKRLSRPGCVQSSPSAAVQVVKGPCRGAVFHNQMLWTTRACMLGASHCQLHTEGGVFPDGFCTKSTAKGLLTEARYCQGWTSSVATAICLRTS